ncbi:hypothetical protein [Sweetwater Branch virus]|uniref:Uncharacterized protein n=1 Tax=Sweetwater Branch virus TaxID=1272958 RepID=A0A0D3R158_9RHAB|nr:hypothetical protein [Sweetwater Branch virus]AJR28393.1 hypothetical protein [Sweetwater Branch virus]
MDQTWMVTVTVEVRSSCLFSLKLDDTILNLIQCLPTNVVNPSKFIINSLIIPLAMRDCFNKMNCWQDPTGSKGSHTAVIKVRLDGLNNSEHDWAESLTCHWLDKSTGFYVMADVTFVGHKLECEVDCSMTETDCDMISKFASFIPINYNKFHHSKYTLIIEKYRVNIKAP